MLMVQINRNLFISEKNKTFSHILLKTQGDPGFLDRGFKFSKGGFDLLTLPDFSLIFPDFSENSP